jgi:hypothetical protein
MGFAPEGTQSAARQADSRRRCAGSSVSDPDPAMRQFCLFLLDHYASDVYLAPPHKISATGLGCVKTRQRRSAVEKRSVRSQLRTQKIRKPGSVLVDVVEKVGGTLATRNNRIAHDDFLNLSCAFDACFESILLTALSQNRFSTASATTGHHLQDRLRARSIRRTSWL